MSGSFAPWRGCWMRTRVPCHIHLGPFHPRRLEGGRGKTPWTLRSHLPKLGPGEGGQSWMLRSPHPPKELLSVVSDTWVPS